MARLQFSVKDRARIHSMSRLFSDRFGVMSWLDVAATSPSDAKVFLLKLGQANLLHLGGVNSFSAACSPSFRQALYAVFGEALERYALFLPQYERYRVGTYNELKGQLTLVSPESWTLFRADQYAQKSFPYNPWNADTPIAWIQSRDLVFGTEIWVPLDGAMTVDRDVPGFERVQHIDDFTSSGGAAGDSYAMAAVGAIHELIERDGVMWHWWTKTPPPKLDWRQLLEKADFSAFRPLMSKVEVFDARTDVNVPTAMAIYRGDNREGEPSFLIGAASGARIEKAIHKALSEVSHLLIRSRAGHRQRMSWSPPDNMDDVTGFLQHVLLYHREEHRHKTDFLFGSEKVSRLDDFPKGSLDPEKRLDELASEMKRVGLRVSLADMTTFDVSGVGVQVVRAFSPDLIPLNARHLLRYWGRPRLGNGPLNQDPHPFP